MEHVTEQQLTRRQSTVWRALRAAAPQTIPVLAGYFVLGWAMAFMCSRWACRVDAHAHGHGGLRRFAGICAGKPAAERVLTPFGVSDGAHDPGAAFVLTALPCGTLQGLRPAQLLYDLCHERRDLFHHLFGRAAGRGGQGWFIVLHHPAGSVLLVASAGLGAVVGSVLPFSTEGVDFVMTAMFTVIFLNQWEKDRSTTAP